MKATEFYSRISPLESDVGECINYLCPLCNKIADNSNELMDRKGGLSSKDESVTAIMVRKALPEEHGTGRSQCIHSQEAKGDSFWYPLGFSFITQHKTTIYGMQLFTFRWIPLNVYLSGNTHECVSMVIISAVYVTMKVDYHRLWKEGTVLELASSFLSASTIAWLCHSVSL